MSDISVLGIFVADISFSGSKIPAVGETILGNKYNVGPGGKGCNQAVAIARLGAKVNFISKIGKDSYGELALEIAGNIKGSSYTTIGDWIQGEGIAAGDIPPYMYSQRTTDIEKLDPEEMLFSTDFDLI